MQTSLWKVSKSAAVKMLMPWPVEVVVKNAMEFSVYFSCPLSTASVKVPEALTAIFATFSAPKFVGGNHEAPVFRSAEVQL